MAPISWGLEAGQGLQLFQGRPQLREKTRFTKELAQLHNGVGGRGKPEGQHAGDADEILSGRPTGQP